MFGMNGQNLGDIEADIAAQEAYGGGWADVGDPGMGGPMGPSSQSGEDALDESNNPTNPAGGRPTANFNTATLSGAMRSAASNIGSFLSNITNNFDVTSMIPGVGMMQGLGSIMGMMGYNENPNNFNFANRTAFDDALRDQYTDPNTYDFDNLTTTFTGPEQGRQGLISAAMSGSGARMGIATGRNPQGLNIGPGFQGSQNVGPGFGVNPYSGVGMADPPDPYIRQRRGTEMAAMIGP
jgi:hypothetical protein